MKQPIPGSTPQPFTRRSGLALRWSLACCLAGSTLGAPAFADEDIDILFLGNSYTSWSGANIDVPGTFEEIATAAGKNVHVVNGAHPGWDLGDHASDSVALIQSEAWDVVVLQELSWLPQPSYGGGAGYADFLGHLADLQSLIADNNDCTRVMLYLTPAYDDGMSAVDTYDDMQDRVTEGYLGGADQAEGIVAPVGEAVRVLRSNPFIGPLKQADGSHPNLRGVYTAAVSVYERVFEDTEGLVAVGVTPGEASLITSAVEATASLGGWDASVAGQASAPWWCSQDPCPSTDNPATPYVVYYAHDFEVCLEESFEFYVEFATGHGVSYESEPDGIRSMCETFWDDECGCGVQCSSVPPVRMGERPPAAD
jgi:hypothetical protein